MLREKTINLEDRGNALTFRIREMPATQLESWVMRAVLVLADAGSDIPADAGVEGAAAFLAKHGLAALGKVDYDRAKPLLDEMLACASRVMDKAEERVTPESADAYVSDFRTLFKLRMECFKLNFDFFETGAPSGSPEKPNTAKVSARRVA